MKDTDGKFMDTDGICVGICNSYLYMLRRQKIAVGFGTFLLGAIIWIIADLFMFYAAKEIIRVLWTFLWGLGIALSSAGLRYFADAFEAVGVLEGGRTRDELDRSNHAVLRTASIVSSLVMTAVLLLWLLVLPSASDGQLPLILRIVQIQLPLLPMIFAVLAALNQPLDARSYEKLMIYLDGEEGDERIRENLRSLLFYPIFTDAGRHEFRIGEPVRYDASLPPRESKAAIAAELHARMTGLSSGSCRT